MKANSVFIVALLLLVGGVTFNQWRLQVGLNRLAAQLNTPPDNSLMEQANARLHEAEEKLAEARQQYQLAEQRLANANSRPMILGGVRPAGGRTVVMDTSDVVTAEPPADPNVKRSWGPEQAVGAPDTLQAGDIPTAWASLLPDGGEEWLKLDYERAVDITEVRVRETYNPGAISKVVAVLPNASEVVLWEGTEPQSEAPVEMGFGVTVSVKASSVKVYLDTKRVPGWNEIDAVELIGKDGTRQWAKQASASSTFAQPRGAGSPANRLIELESTRF